MRPTIVAGIDSETCHGEPITIQVYSEESSRLTKCIWLTKDSNLATTTLLKHLRKHCRPNVLYRIYGHNLKFDLVSFFWPVLDQINTLTGAFDFAIGDWLISGVYGSPTFAKLKHSSGIEVDIVDSYLWFSSSLARAADLYCPDLPKLPRPKGLGSIRFTTRHEGFYEYAMQDSIIACRLGRLIENMHQDLEIASQVSLAGMSSAVFRAHFLKHDMQQVPREFIQPAVYAYHGGKNNTVEGAERCWHENIHAYDLSSAYPYAMCSMPGFTELDRYREYKRQRSQMVKSVPPHGVYLISGMTATCHWPSLFDHGFNPIQGTFEDVWVNSDDLNEALSTDEVRLKRIAGLYYDPPDNESQPLRIFSEHFYREKQQAADPIVRFRSKILLNSLYGKFIQTRDVLITDDGTVRKEKEAAGLFQPLVAGGITSHTRRLMHQIEHATRAVHTATDGVFCYRKPLHSLGLPREGLGSLQHEGSGTLALLRNKLYILYANDGEINSTVFHDLKIKKFARHAFQGTLRDLETFLAFGRRKYVVNKPNTLRDSLKRGLVPNDFVEHVYTLRIGDMRMFNRSTLKGEK